MKHSVYCLDAIKFLKSLPTASVDLMITDPAYESLEKWRAIGTTTRLKKTWFEVFPNSRYQEFFEEAFRVLKKNSHLYVMSDQETMFILKEQGPKAGFIYQKFLIWDKVKIGMGYNYRSQHELVSFLKKGKKRKLNNKGMGDVISIPRIRTSFPTEKPVELYEKLILQSSQPGEVVCDPFCGAGASGVACVKNNRIFLGNDKSLKAAIISYNKLI